MNTKRWIPTGVVVLLIAGVGVGGVLAGLATSGASETRPPTIFLPEPLANDAGSQFGNLTASEHVLSVREDSGFRAELLSAQNLDGRLTIQYRVARDAAYSGWGEMLGIPRIVNPDGSVVLPSQYGQIGPQLGRSAAGLAEERTSAAAFDSDRVSAGAEFRIGPFFVARSEGFGLAATGAELAEGFPFSIAREQFVARMNPTSDGNTEIHFTNVELKGTNEASHPATRFTITVAGKAVSDLGGSKQFREDSGNGCGTQYVVADGFRSHSFSGPGRNLGFVHRARCERKVGFCT